MFEPGQQQQQRRRSKRAREIGTWENVLIEYRDHVNKVMEVCVLAGINPRMLDRNGHTLQDVLWLKGLISRERAAL